MKPKSSFPQAERRFLSDLREIRERARRRMERGPITENYRGDPAIVAGLFNEALATETVCVLRYSQHAIVASGLNSPAVAEEFREHAREERHHAERLAERIHQLGGTPDLDPHNLIGRSHSEYVEGHSLEQMIEENLAAERIAIESYREIIDYIGDSDSTSRRIMEDILAKEEEHAHDMATLLEQPRKQTMRQVI